MRSHNLFPTVIQSWPNRDPIGDIAFLKTKPYVQIEHHVQRAYPRTAHLVETWQGPNLYGYVGNRPISVVDAYGLWGVKVLGVNVGYGDPTFDFDFDQNDWRELKEQYRCNGTTSFWFAAAGNKVAAINPSPLNLATAVAADGYFFGSAIGYSIANFWVSFY